jgi:hypothetical protein
MMARLSEPLWSQEGVSQVDQQPQGHESGERVVEGHDQFSSELIAGVAVADRQNEEAKADGQHDGVQHW